MMTSQTPLQLIRKEKTFSNGRLKKAVYKMFTIRKTFDARFQAVQLSNSLGKMVGVSLTMIISTIMITMSTTIPIILQNNIRYSYGGDNYKTLVEYNSPIYNLPTTFLKTYDPSQKPWDSNDSPLANTNMTKDANQYLANFETGQINPENYAPTYNAEDMRSLLYRNISKEFLQSKKLQSKNAGLSTAVCTTTWGDYKDYGLNNLTKTTIEQYLRTTETARENINALENYRLFYWKYRDTIGLDIKRDNYFDKNGNISLDNNLDQTMFTQADYQRDFGQGNPTIVLDDNHFRQALEQPLSRSFYDVLDSGTGTDFNTLLKKPMYDLYNWIYAYFVQNVNQCFIQGVYSRSPQTVRVKMQDAFTNPNNNFNLAFGVIPFNPLTDDRGTMVNAELNSIDFKIYGINKTFKNKILTNKNKENLNQKLFNKNNNIVLNETLAKRLGVIGRKEKITLFCAIESAKGVLNAYNIATASSRVEGIALGGVDYLFDLKAVKTKDRHELLFARQMIVHAARAAKVDAFDCIFGNTNDLVGLEQEAQFVRELGFNGKSAIHPNQIEIINKIFSPSEKEIKEALKILTAYKEFTKEQKGVFAIDGQMIDKPFIDNAEIVLRMANIKNPMED